MGNVFRYFSKYTDGNTERFELFWAPSDIAAEKEAKELTIDDGLPLEEVSRCMCIVPRVKEIKETKITHRMKLKGM
jgi:hypothetical protein